MNDENPQNDDQVQQTPEPAPPVDAGTPAPDNSEENNDDDVVTDEEVAEIEDTSVEDVASREDGETQTVTPQAPETD